MDHKKRRHETPRMTVFIFGTKDIITTSGFAGSEIPLRPTAMADVSDEIF